MHYYVVVNSIDYIDCMGVDIDCKDFGIDYMGFGIDCDCSFGRYFGRGFGYCCRLILMHGKISIIF